MSLIINNKSIQRVMVIDDQPDARDAMAFSVEDADLEPIFHDRPFNSITECLSTVTTADAAIFDHHLKPSNYANFNGASVVAQLYQQKFPSLLVTAWAKVDIDNIRPFRQHIPILIKSGHAESQIIQSGFEQCINEFSGQYSFSRKPWRTLVRIEEIDLQILRVYVVIPGWDPNEVVSLPLLMFSESQRKELVPKARFFAKVNTGADHQEELYLTDFEIIEKPRGKYAKFLRS
jgi:CheY-like chemotaxis protein